MAKLTKAIRGVAKGEIYPRMFAAGEECPPELEAAAIALKALPKAGGKNGNRGDAGTGADGGTDDTATAAVAGDAGTAEGK